MSKQSQQLLKQLLIEYQHFYLLCFIQNIQNSSFLYLFYQLIEKKFLLSFQNLLRINSQHLMQNPKKSFKDVKSDDIVTKAKTSQQFINLSVSTKKQSSYGPSFQCYSQLESNNVAKHQLQTHQKLVQSPNHKISRSNFYPQSLYLEKNLPTQKKTKNRQEDQHKEVNPIKQIYLKIRLEEFLFKMKVKFVQMLEQLGCPSQQILIIKQLDNQIQLLNKSIEVFKSWFLRSRRNAELNENNDITQNLIDKEYLKKAKLQLKQAYQVEQKIFERHRKLKSQHKLNIEKKSILENQLNVQKEQNYQLKIINKKHAETIQNLKRQLHEKQKAIQVVKTTLQAKALKYKNLYEQEQTSKNQLKQRFQNSQDELEQHLKIEQQYSNQIQASKKEVFKWRDRCKWIEQQSNKQTKEIEKFKHLKKQISQLKQAIEKYKEQRMELEGKNATLKMENQHLLMKLQKLKYENQRYIDQQKQNIQITIMQWKQKLVDTIQQYQKLLQEKHKQSINRSS